MSVAKVTISVQRCTCERCGKAWVSRFERVPLKCIGCKSLYWNKPRERGLDHKGGTWFLKAGKKRKRVTAKEKKL